ncbi:hypothetical protein NQ317_008790 [Molorchus minor]|uniref:Ninjurin-1 n=1 Tax=Molorchus minor TaxID=1323400 RepID=A0ABQ9IYU0_9CUCU|nr:hypothetical protein NQ317_008790 [Molorchus minor]
MERDMPTAENIEIDGNAVYKAIKKSMDLNKYATKKTIAQGLLDVALLTANASQLKYVLQVGEQHEFYTLMLSLITISIVLQLIVAIMFVIIGGLNVQKQTDHKAAIVLNDIILIFVFFISIINIIISGFGLDYSSHPLRLLDSHDKEGERLVSHPNVVHCILLYIAESEWEGVTAALLSVIVAILRVSTDEKLDMLAWILNHISLGFVTAALFSDIIKMNFGLDPAIAVNVIQACICILLGSSLNINKEGDHPNANKANNVILCANIVIMAVNILINAFEMKEAEQSKT